MAEAARMRSFGVGTFEGSRTPLQSARPAQKSKQLTLTGAVRELGPTHEV